MCVQKTSSASKLTAAFHVILALHWRLSVAGPVIPRECSKKGSAAEKNKHSNERKAEKGRGSCVSACETHLVHVNHGSAITLCVEAHVQRCSKCIELQVSLTWHVRIDSKCTDGIRKSPSPDSFTLRTQLDDKHNRSQECL